ncbi:MAG: shikimate kinase AroL [Deltaproteobacteria bacterium]|nr:shikimate kinase AroL [Candidatus Tharpella aukensis]
MNNINLIGYRGCGKSAVGRKLAGVLRRSFVDSDAVIVERVGLSIAEYVAESGWERFRLLESEVLRDCCHKDEVVLATGGGVVLVRENRSLLKKSGITMWLQASSETIQKRLNHDPQSSSLRPPLSSLSQADEILTGLKEREPLYRELADFIIEVDEQSVNAIVQQIVNNLTRQSRNLKKRFLAKTQRRKEGQKQT